MGTRTLSAKITSVWPLHICSLCVSFNGVRMPLSRCATEQERTHEVPDLSADLGPAGAARRAGARRRAWQSVGHVGGARAQTAGDPARVVAWPCREDAR